MRFDDALAYFERKVRNIGFCRDREVFTKPIQGAWSYWLIVSGNNYIIASNLGLLNSEVSQLVHSSLRRTSGVDVRELTKNSVNIPVYQLPLQAIESGASKLRALNLHRDGVYEADLDHLVDFIVQVGIPSLDKMMDLRRIGKMLESDFSSQLGTYLTPAVLFLSGNKEDAESRMKEQARALGANRKALRIYLSYCDALRANVAEIR